MKCINKEDIDKIKDNIPIQEMIDKYNAIKAKPKSLSRSDLEDFKEYLINLGIDKLSNQIAIYKKFEYAKREDKNFNAQNFFKLIKPTITVDVD